MFVTIKCCCILSGPPCIFTRTHKRTHTSIRANCVSAVYETMQNYNIIWRQSKWTLSTTVYSNTVGYFHDNSWNSASWLATLGSFRRATQRAAVRRRKQPTSTVLLSSGRCAIQALSRMSDAAQPCIVCVHVTHERIPSPGKVSNWLILQLRRTSRTNLIFWRLP